MCSMQVTKSNANVTKARFDEKPESSSNANVTRARLDEKTESPSNTEKVNGSRQQTEK